MSRHHCRPFYATHGDATIDQRQGRQTPRGDAWQSDAPKPDFGPSAVHLVQSPASESATARSTFARDCRRALRPSAAVTLGLLLLLFGAVALAAGSHGTVSLWGLDVSW